MNPESNLRFGNLITHFVPGAFLLIIMFNTLLYDKFNLQSWLLSFFKKNSILGIIVFMVSSLVIGLLIDSVRYMSIIILNAIPAYRKWNVYRKTPNTKEEIQIYNWIMDNYYRHHQFFGNLAIALIIAGLLLKDTRALWPIIMIAPLLITASVITFITSINSYRKNFPS